MSAHSKKLVLIVACVAGVLSLAAATVPGPESADSREVTRLRHHFATVLSELRVADVGHLSASQRAARTTLIGRLEEYAAVGRFPHNHVAPGRRVPVFRDEHGTMCAMAYLIASTGRSDIVNDVARHNNLAYIPELAGDARLRAWLDSTGLSVAEAARIQPSYDGGICLCPSPIPATTEVNQTSGAYFTASAFATVLSGVSLVRNLAPRDVSEKRIRGNAALGFVVGAAQVVLGGFAIDRRGTGGVVGAANMVIGASSIAGGVWRAQHLPKTISIAPVTDGRRSVGLVISAPL
jgi:hypothetical protein